MHQSRLLHVGSQIDSGQDVFHGSYGDLCAGFKYCVIKNSPLLATDHAAHDIHWLRTVSRSAGMPHQLPCEHVEASEQVWVQEHDSAGSSGKCVGLDGCRSLCHLREVKHVLNQCAYTDLTYRDWRIFQWREDTDSGTTR